MIFAGGRSITPRLLPEAVLVNYIDMPWRLARQLAAPALACALPRRATLI